MTAFSKNYLIRLQMNLVVLQTNFLVGLYQNDPGSQDDAKTLVKYLDPGVVQGQQTEEKEEFCLKP